MTGLYEDVLRLEETLPREEQISLIRELAERGTSGAPSPASVMELCGLCREMWGNRDAQEYVDAERASWIG